MPTTVDHAQRRERIVTAVCQVLSTSGLDGLSMRRIAEAAGCTTGMVTHYFASKQELVGAALDHIREEHDGRARALFTADPSHPIAALEQLLPLDEERAQAMRVWLGFYAAAIANDRLRRRHVEIFTRWRDELLTALSATGITDDDTRTDVADQLIIALNGMVTQALLDPDHWTPERQRRMLARLVADTVGPARR